MKVDVGDSAPLFSLLDQHGEEWSLKAHRGTPVVLYFYPKDDTRGCTIQACDVRDHWADFEELGVPVAGISPDEVESHARFAGKFSLPFTLLADPDRVAIDAYGVWGPRNMYGKVRHGVHRSSVVIDADGKVAAVFRRIKPEEQSEKALAVIKGLTG